MELPATLTPIEQRLLGCLIEKEATTPDVYPLTVNALVLAANQKSNREPLMDLEPGEVGHAIRQMESRGLVAAVDGARAVRYAHRCTQAYSLTRQQQALLGVMLLRGPQTLGELLLRSERMASFADAGEVQHCLERLAQREPPLAANLGRASGQREDRYMHLLGGPVELGSREVDTTHATERRDASGAPALRERVDALETELAALRAEFEALREALGEAPPHGGA